jgi:hypothetical protein
MQTYINNRRRAQPRIEDLEGKILLSAGSPVDQIKPHVSHNPIVAQAIATFSGTLTGTYSNVHIPFAGYLLNYATSGTLTGAGSTQLRGSLFVRGGAHPGRLLGTFRIHNNGGSMLVNVFQTATPGTYTYRVASASGSDSGFKGSSGDLMISQTPTHSAPYFVSGQAAVTFATG